MSVPRVSRVARTAAQKCLDEFGTNTRHVRSAVLLSADGFEIAALRLDHHGASRMAAMGSSLAAVASAITQEAGLSGFERMLVESEAGIVLVLHVPAALSTLAFVVVAEKKAVLGQLLWSSAACVAAISGAFNAS